MECNERELFTHTENGTVNASRVSTVQRMIAVEYAGHEGGIGRAVARSRKPSLRTSKLTNVLRGRFRWRPS